MVALTSLGLSLEQVARALSVSEASVRSWRDGRHAPSISVAQGLDDLRYTVHKLLERGLPARRVAPWLTSACDDLSEPTGVAARPLEAIGQNPVRVLAAAYAYTNEPASALFVVPTENEVSA